MKPVPESVRHLVANPDDEVFLDERNEDIQNDVTMDSGRNIQRRRRDVEDIYHKHIVYRRSSSRDEDDFSDYGERRGL